MEKVDLESGSDDFDDGYDKSDENSSYHSACETLVDSKSTASSTSGLASNTSSQCKDSEDVAISNLCEVVNKISISQQVNDAIFKPGKSHHTCHYGGAESIQNHSVVGFLTFHFFILVVDYRLSLKRHDPPKYWAQQNLLEINFLEEHTKESWYVLPLSSQLNYISKNNIWNNFFIQRNGGCEQ